MSFDPDAGTQHSDQGPEPPAEFRSGARPGLLSLWFGLSTEVTPLAYAASGFGLVALKYAVEAQAIWTYTGRFFTPVDFLNPLLSMRQKFFEAPAPEWLPWVLFFWTIPFLWVAISMSVRRAANAGASPWLGLMVLVPLLNYLVMLLLCVIPSRGGASWCRREEAPANQSMLRSALFGLLLSQGLALVMVVAGIYLMRDYGVVLFLGTPIVMGAVSAFFYNRPFARSFLGSLLLAQLSILLAGGVLLLFAFEGVICLVMLYPVAGVMAILGGLIGFSLGAMTATPRRNMLLFALLLPLAAGAERVYKPLPLFEVQSAIEIDAPPESVWPHVVGFSELPEPPAWYFKLGIAYPRRATIDGSGPGAVRRCEFSTGSFVEPITAWEPPRRLAFDVSSQPAPMHELSPYRHVHPPHLDGYLRCKRGEFRLVRLDGGRTRLEGSTWYEFAMYPNDYWTMWSDLVIHRIHLRVLRHIKRLAEEATVAAE